MWTVLIAALLSSTPGPAEAESLAGKQAWDELYLAFAATRPDGVPDADRKRIATALLKGCEALRSKDAVLAVSLGEGAYRFAPTAPAALCQAQSALASSQRDLAETALREAHARFSSDASITLALGSLLHEERQFEEAITILGRIPKRAREAAAAKRLMAAARAEIAASRAARSEAERLERRAARGEPLGTGGGTRQATSSSDRTQAVERTAGSGQLGGMRTRTHGGFDIRYFNNERDFGQRADYEGRIAEALDDASGFTRRILGFSRERPVEVILYTREEFRAHMGELAALTVAGLYSMNAIRINDAAELTRERRATLTHEYVHAVVDELADGRTSNVPTWLNEGLAEYVEWRYLGSEDAPYALRVSLRGAALAGRLPRLATLAAGGLLGTSDPHLSYAVSALAVRRMLQVGGSNKLRALIREMGAGRSFSDALQRHFGLDVEALDAEVASVAASR